MPETSLLAVLGCGLEWVAGPNFFFYDGLSWVGLGQSVGGLVGLGQRKQTHGQL